MGNLFETEAEYVSFLGNCLYIRLVNSIRFTHGTGNPER